MKNAFSLKANLIITFIFITFINAYSQIKVRYVKNSDNSLSFYYDKEPIGSYTVAVKITSLTNSTAKKTPRTIKASSGQLLKLRPINEKRSISFSSFYCEFVRGSVNTNIDSSFVYLLPFKDNTTTVIKEGYYLWKYLLNRDLPKSWKSYQFINTQDSALAARKGIVIEIIDTYKINPSNTYTSNQNQILVEHKDGTIGIYQGFIKNGSLVKEGDIVYPHTPLCLLKNGDIQSNLSFMVYYLKNPLLFQTAKEQLEKKLNRYQYITPTFLTTEGEIKLEDGSNYQVTSSTDIIKAEMTRKEKKRY